MTLFPNIGMRLQLRIINPKIELMKIDIPVPFTGTQEQADRNFRTHNFSNFGDEPACLNCDCKPWHIAADYPCGAEIPRTFIN